MARRIVHRIQAKSAPQRRVQCDPTSTPSSARVSHSQAVGPTTVTLSPPGSASGEAEFRRSVAQFVDAAAGGPGDVLSAFGMPRGAAGRSRDGAPPSTVFRVLEAQRASGRNISAVADRVAAVRWNARLAPSSLLSYASHLRMVEWGCRVFGIDPSCPDIIGIRRIAACVNNHSTLSCWLTAWKSALEALGHPWPGDDDPILRGIRRGTRRLQVPRMPRHRVRRKLLRQLLGTAVLKRSQDWQRWTFLAAIAHSFALRMPSELFSQFSIGKLRRSYEGWEYGPIKRKLRLDWQFVKSFCCCATAPLLCVCAWHRLWPELDHSRPLGGNQATKWTANLRTLLVELGIPDAQEYHGHDIRRGAAVDIFSERGVAAMLQHCNWRTLGSAAPYVPADEVQAGLVAQGFADESEPES